MGCCVSSDIGKNNNNRGEASTPSKPQNLQDRALVPEPETTSFEPTKPPKSLSPPPPLLEEETVKEVLSETPTVPKPNPHPQQQQQKHQQKLLKLPTFPKIQEEQPLQERIKQTHLVKKPLTDEISEELVLHEEEEEEEESEMYSFVSESVSTSALTTTTATDQRIRDYEDDGSEVTQKLHRPTTPSKTPNIRKRSVPNRSPARRSPAKRAVENSGQPSFAGRDMGLSQTAARRRILAGNGCRTRDSGESSWRRSPSPVTRAEAIGRPGVCRSPSARRVAAERSPGRNPAEGRRVVGEDVREEDHWVSKESLEDPLVSLECFIFL